MALTSYRNDGLTFEVDDSGGDGEVVVLLHGFPQSRTSWSKLTPHLVQAGYRVLAPDQRGYSPGARPKRRRDYAIDLLVADIVALADNAVPDGFTWSATTGEAGPPGRSPSVIPNGCCR